MTRMMLFAAAFSLLPHAGAAVPQTENLAPEKRVCTGEDSAADSKCYVCEGANPGGYGGRCVEKLFKGLDLPNCQAVCTPPPPPVNFSCTGATAFATKKVCDFVSQWNDAGLPKGAMISLICTPEEQCTISGTKLGANTENGRETDFGFQGDATMTNVLVKDMFGNKSLGVAGHLCRDCRGGLMEVGSAGRVVGTNIIFRNGLVRADGGGCVYTKGNFACTDCTFDKCITAAGFGGGIESGGGGALNLVRPTFTNSACALGANCGSGCSCDGDDRRGQGMNASLCVGCTCKKTDNLAFYCDSN